ncbi:MAG: AAA family ATPase [Lentimonas sp.]
MAPIDTGFGMKRIVLTGAESTGKSTLAAALSGYYGEPWTAEFVRQYVDQKNRELTADDLEPIAEGQFNCEDQALEQAKRFIIHDTNILSSILYANHYFEVTLDWVNERFLERDYTLYLLCIPDIPWVADEGQRESPETRAQLHELFKRSLEKLSLPYVEISGNETERFGVAISEIDKVLKS